MLTYTLAKMIDDALGAELSNWDRFLLLFFFFWPFTLRINLLFLPPAHICFLHLHSCWKLLSISLFNTFSYQSSTGFIWPLHNSSSSVSWPFRGLTKQTASSKWNLTLNRGLISSGKSCIKRSNCIHWQMLWHRETPSGLHVDAQQRVNVRS